jgi:hypothetical protein
MKLHYCKTPSGNFGDDLNTWLWPTLLGENFFDTNEDALFLGVGTILNQKIPRTPEKNYPWHGLSTTPKNRREIQRLLRPRPPYRKGFEFTR